MKALGWKSDYRSIFSLESCGTLDNSKCGSIANRGSHVQDVQKRLLSPNVNVNVRVVESAIVSPTQFNKTLAPRSPNAAMAPTQTLQEPTRLWMVHHPKVLHSIGLRNGRSCCLHLLRYRYCFFFFPPTQHLLDSFSAWMLPWPNVTARKPAARAQTRTAREHSAPISHDPASQPGKRMKVMVQLGKEGKNNLIHKLAKVN